MLEALVHRKRDFVRLDTSPAREFLEPFANALAEEQYSHSTIVRCVFAADRLSRSMRLRGQAVRQPSLTVAPKSGDGHWPRNEAAGAGG